MSEERPSLSVASFSAMEVQKVLHMNGGEGDTSYANNSLLQKMAMLKVKPILRESIAELYWTRFPEMECLKVADMGCSSGPNALLPTWEIIESINLISQQLNRKPPVLQVFLNDLPGSDFNTVFKSLPSFYERVEKEKGGGGGKCFIAGVPGSFHGRLFPDHSLHFVHSSYSLHWLSQVPKGFDLGKPLNKGNIYIAATSPPSVHKAYSDQFNRDFTAFLASRSEEMIPGGRMVITILGKNNDEDRCTPWELLGISLNDMVMEGLIEEGKLDSFDAPIYVSPSAEEVKRIIETEGSFRILRLEIFYLSWDANIGNGDQNLIFDNNARAEYVSMYFRAFTESILTSHFGDAIMEDLYKRFTRKIADYMAMGKGVHPNLVISLTTK